MFQDASYNITPRNERTKGFTDGLGQPAHHQARHIVRMSRRKVSRRSWAKASRSGCLNFVLRYGLLHLGFEADSIDAARQVTRKINIVCSHHPSCVLRDGNISAPAQDTIAPDFARKRTF